MIPDPRSVALALGVPTLTLVVGIIVLGPGGRLVAGVPAIYLLIFALFPLTTALMYASWHLWDRHGDHEGTDDVPTPTTPDEREHA